MDRTPVHLAVLAIVEDATTGDLSSANVAIERATEAGHRAVAQDLASTEPEIRAQLTRWIGQPHIDVVVVVGDDRGATKAALAPLVTEALLGFANVWAARCSSKLIFVLPPLPAAAKAAMDATVLPKLDSRRSDSLVKLLPRLAKPRGKPRTGKNVVKRDGDDDFDPPTKPIDVEGLERQIAMSAAENPTRQVDLAKLTSMAAESSDDDDNDNDDDDDDELALQKPKRPAFLAAKTTIAIPPATPKAANPKLAPPAPVQPAPAAPQKIATTTPRPPAIPRLAPATGAPVGTPPPIPTSRATMQTPAMGAPVTATQPPMPRPIAPPVPPSPNLQTPPAGIPVVASTRTSTQASPPALPKTQIPTSRATMQTPPMGAPIAAPPPTLAARPTGQPPAMGAPIAPPPPRAATEQRRSIVPTPPMPMPVVAKPAEPAHVVLVSAADPSDRGWTQPMEPVARPVAPMPTDPGWTQPLPVERAAAPPRTPPAGTPMLPAPVPDAPPPPIPRRTIATPAAGLPIARPVEVDSETTDVLPVQPQPPALPLPPPPPTTPKRPTVATPPAGLPIAAAPPAPPPRHPRAVGIRPEEGDPFEGAPPTPPPPLAAAPPRPRPPTPPPPPPLAEPNRWDAPANVDAVPRAMTPRGVRADKTMVVKIPGRGPSKRVIALLLFAAGCAVIAAVVVVMHHQNGTVPIDAPGAMIVAATQSDAAVAVVDPTPDAAVEPEIEVDPTKHDAGVARPPVNPPPPRTGSATPPQPHTGSATPPITPHTGSATPPHTGSATPPPITPIEPAHPLPPGPPPEAGCDEVSCVLDRYARPCCARWKPVDTGFDPKTTMPERLDRAMVKEGVERMKPRVIACGEKTPVKGTVKLSITVGPDGSVSNVSVSDAPDAALGECVATVLRKASFGKTINGATFVYPFAF